MTNVQKKYMYMAHYRGSKVQLSFILNFSIIFLIFILKSYKMMLILKVLLWPIFTHWQQIIRLHSWKYTLRRQMYQMQLRRHQQVHIDILYPHFLNSQPSSIYHFQICNLCLFYKETKFRHLQTKPNIPIE